MCRWGSEYVQPISCRHFPAAGPGPGGRGITECLHNVSGHGDQMLTYIILSYTTLHKNFYLQ